MKITYYGHSVFLIEGTGIRALIDPFFKFNPLSNKKWEDFTGITHIFVTHGHGDHLGDTINIAEKCSSQIICNAEIGGYLSSCGIKNVHTMHIGGRTRMAFGTVKMTPALHGSGIKTNNGVICGGNPGGFLIEVEGKKIYHAGDTGLSMEMKLLEHENIDAALLPIGGNYTMDIDDAVTAIGFIKPKTVIPMHYNTFDTIKADPKLFMDKIKEVKVIILNSGEFIGL